MRSPKVVSITSSRPRLGSRRSRTSRTTPRAGEGEPQYRYTAPESGAALFVRSPSTPLVLLSSPGAPTARYQALPLSATEAPKPSFSAGLGALIRERRRHVATEPAGGGTRSYRCTQPWGSPPNDPVVAPAPDAVHRESPTARKRPKRSNSSTLPQVPDMVGKGVGSWMAVSLIHWALAQRNIPIPKSFWAHQL